MPRKAKLTNYRVRLWGHLPCSAEMTVEAESQEAAREYAMDHFEEADWDGADYSKPDGGGFEDAEVIGVAE